jgi:TRAP-type C4-dicarboxylate transport system permease small subunit
VNPKQAPEGLSVEPGLDETPVLRIGVLDGAVVIAFGVMIVAVSLQVFFRYVLNDPLAGSEEIGRLAFVWVTFIGAAVASRDGLHVRIDYFANRLGPLGRRNSRLIEHAATACFGVLMVWVGVLLSIFSWNYESASLQFPMTLVHASVPVSGALLTVMSLRNAWTDLTARQESE